MTCKNAKCKSLLDQELYTYNYLCTTREEKSSLFEEESITARVGLKADRL
jgi:hypothetical protein